MTEVARDDHADPTEPRWYAGSVRDHPAATVLLVGLLGALPILVFCLGSSRWFNDDEWDFLATRSATNLGDLFRPHNENLSTLPVLIYRATFSLVQLHSYWPYQVAVVSAHLAVVGLIWIVMRRSGVNQWVSLLTAGLLLFFGSGSDDILWGFQVGFTGALAFGLVQLILADRDGPIAPRDWWALLMGLCALLCSGVGVSAVVTVGVACLLRRGWRPAAFQTVPLGIFYLIWVHLAHPDGPPRSHATSWYVTRQVAKWDVASLRFAFHDLGRYTPVAVALGVLFVVGLVLAWVPMGRDVLRRQSMIIATMVGSVVFVSITGVGRWIFGSSSSGQSRYVYLSVALLLPALGVAADAVIRRWHVLTPAVVLLLLIGVPGNIEAFDHPVPRPSSARMQTQLVASLGQSPEIARLPPRTPVDPVVFPGLTTGWLAEAHRKGWLSRPVITRAGAPVLLGVIQSTQPPPRSGTCQPVPPALTLTLRAGDSFWEPAPVAGTPGPATGLTVTPLNAKGRPASSPHRYDPSNGTHFTMVLPGPSPVRIQTQVVWAPPVNICR